MREDEGKVGDEMPGPVDNKNIKQFPHSSIGAINSNIRSIEIGKFSNT